jgi:type IV pilus assembly protein PilX
MQIGSATQSFGKYIVKQRGAVLAICLLILLIMTSLALGASQFIGLREQAATLLLEKNLAFQAAEAALRGGERFIANSSLSLTTSPCGAGKCQIYQANYFDENITSRPESWWTTNAQKYHAPREAQPLVPAASTTSFDTYFLIEMVQRVNDTIGFSMDGPPRGTTYYRVTATSFGRSNDIQVVLQTVYAHRSG